MIGCNLLWAAGLALAAAAPELVVLPPMADGVTAKRAIEAHKAISQALEQSKRSAIFSLTLHREIKSALLGPGRERAQKCGKKTQCLAELGRTLGGSLVLAGTVSRHALSLTLIRSSDGREMAKAESPPALARRPLGKRAEHTLESLLDHYEKELANEAQATKATTNEPTAAVPAVVAPNSEKLLDDGINGMVRIAATQLVGVVWVMVDGATVPVRQDGSVVWTGAPGSHTVSGRRADGARFFRDVVVNPRQILDVEFEWQAADPVADLNIEPDGGSASAFQSWWFWTSVGAAVIAGGVTGAVLLKGSNDDPSLPGETGSISGAY